MERIASFCVDHTKLDRGMYLSRQDGDVLTMGHPHEKAQSRRLPVHRCRPHAGASVCHLCTQQRLLQDSVIYVGPMGCRTGFYLLTRGLTPAEALELTVESLPLHGWL